MDIEGTETQQARFDRVTGQHKVITPEMLQQADLSGMAPTGDAFPLYDSEGRYLD